MPFIYKNGKKYSGTNNVAGDIVYDNSASGLEVSSVQQAIDHLAINGSGAVDVTLAEYEELLATGKVDPKTTYYITDVDSEDNTISDEFDETKDYVAGEYCIYENKLYKFTDNKAAGEWDGTVVESTSISSELVNISSDISEQNENLGGLRFGVDGDGNPGYYGADDSLIPFKSTEAVLNEDWTLIHSVASVCYPSDSTESHSYKFTGDGLFAIVMCECGNAGLSSGHALTTTATKLSQYEFKNADYGSYSNILFVKAAKNNTVTWTFAKQKNTRGIGMVYKINEYVKGVIYNNGFKNGFALINSETITATESSNKLFFKRSNALNYVMTNKPVNLNVYNKLIVNISGISHAYCIIVKNASTGEQSYVAYDLTTAGDVTFDLSEYTGQYYIGFAPTQSTTAEFYISMIKLEE